MARDPLHPTLNTLSIRRICIGGIARSKYKLLLLTTTHMILSLSNTSKLKLLRMTLLPRQRRAERN